MFILRCRDVKICILSASGNFTLKYFKLYIHREREREIERLKDVCVYIFIYISVPR